MSFTKKIRKKIIVISSVWETIISCLILIAIALFTVNIVIDIARIIPSFFTTDDSFFVGEFLSRSLELIIAIEFLKVVANNTPGSTIELLIFAIARSIIVSHGVPLQELLFGVLSIAVLFGIRKWTPKYDRKVISLKKKPELGNVVKKEVCS